MRLLLDTHVFIWWCAGDRRLRASGRKAIRDATEEGLTFVTADRALRSSEVEALWV